MRMRLPVAAGLAALLVVAAGCSSASRRGASGAHPVSPSPTTAASAPGTSSTGASSGSGPCTGAAPPAQVAHVVWIIMENRSLHQVQGSGSAPYLNQLGHQCGVANNYSGVAHPSLPNYIALTSGSTQGITDDHDPSSHHVPATSIFTLLGSNWRALDQSMPSNCYRTDHGEYAVRHNPAVYYTPLAAACAAQDVPLGPVPDLSARLTVITPNVCNDMHDCSTATGDRWMAAEMPRILDSAQYRAGTTVVFITWDENDSGGSLVPTYVVAPSVVPGTVSSGRFDHYSLLRTTEDMLGLKPLLGKAAGAADMSSAFHL